MKKRMLADVLWDAANKYLSLAEDPMRPLQEFSCHAVYQAAVGENWGRYPSRLDTIDYHLESLGCNTRDAGRFQCEGFERQGIRYMWLLLAMHVAEDEGIEV